MRRSFGSVRAVGAALLVGAAGLSLLSCAAGADGSGGDAAVPAFDGTTTPPVQVDSGAADTGSQIILPSGEGGGVDAGTDALTADDAAIDAGVDATILDAGAPDAAADAAEASAPVDARADAVRDDAGHADAADDALADAPVDANTDAVADAGPDANADADQDAAADASPDATSDAAADAGAPACPLTHLVISQIQSRGAGGGSDEWVELYNPTATAVVLDTTWALRARSYASASFSARWAGGAFTVAPHGHLLIAGAAYTGALAADSSLSTGITDATALALVHGSTLVDEVCYAYSASTIAAFTGDPTFGCPGTPAANPHDDSTGTDVAASLERLPGGALGNCTDTGSSATDFRVDSPSAPRSTASPPAP